MRRGHQRRGRRGGGNTNTERERKCLQYTQELTGASHLLAILRKRGKERQQERKKEKEGPKEEEEEGKIIRRGGRKDIKRS